MEFSEGAAACIVMASAGYPGSYEKGKVITMSAQAAKTTYVAGAALKDGQLVTSGGRVLGVTATADTLQDALTAAYALTKEVQFEGAYKRSDIGRRALAALEG